MPRGDWFSFSPVNKLARISQRRARERERKVFITCVRKSVCVCDSERVCVCVCCV